MKYFFLAFSFLLSAHHFSLAQQVEFVKTYGMSGPASEGRDVVSMPDGGAIIAATQSIAATSGNHEDILLIRIANDGDTLWTKMIGNSLDFHRAESILVLSNGNLLIAGNTRLLGTERDALLIYTDPNGNVIWQKTYGGAGDDVANSVKEAGGDFIIGGATTSLGAGYFDAWLLKVNSNGDSLWSKTFGGAEYDDCWDIELTPEGGFMLTGGNYSFASGMFDDAWLIKTTSNGDLIWRKNYGLANRVDWAWALEPVMIGGTITGYVFVGVKNTEEDMPGAAHGDLHFVKVDTAGNIIWDNSIDGTNGSYRKEGVDIKQLQDGGFMITGWQFSSTARELYLIRTTDNGLAVWDTSLGTSTQAYFPWASSVSTDGSCFVVGRTATPQPSQYISCVKIAGLPTMVKMNSTTGEEVAVYPNPAYEQFSIKSNPGTTVTKVELYSISGQLLQIISNEQANDLTIDIRSYHEKMFIVRMFTSKGVLCTSVVRHE